MKKIIFDLDDTLYKSKNLRQKRETAILDAIKGKEVEYKELRTKYSTIRSLEILGINREEFYEIMRKVPVKLHKDVRLISMLKKLKRNNVLIILSNSPKDLITKVLDQLGVASYFDEIYSADDLKTIKPNVNNFSMVNFGDVCIGNNFEKDLLVPKEKGAITIIVGYDKRANYCVNDIYELEKIILK